MKILDGKQIAGEIRAELRARAEAFESKYGKKAGLAVLLIGDDPASAIYVRNKTRDCEEAGIRSFSYTLPADATQEEAEALIDELAADENVHGILVQLPLPAHLREDRLLAHIPYEKDVDGFSAYNIGSLALGSPAAVACTPKGVMRLLARYGISVSGKRAVVIGRSKIVGRPMAMLLLNADATVTVCHSKTKGLAEICREADILVAAVGKANFVTAEMVKEGAVVIDVGINRVDGKLCGDVDLASVKEKASFLTPVPGGIGPMTVAMLLENTLEAAERQMS